MNPLVTLIAIDEPPVLTLLERAIAQPGLEVIKAVDGSVGWDVIQQRRPDIVIADAVMPGLNGLELLERIVAWNPGTAVVLLTGQYSKQSAVEAIHKGATDYLAKPIDIPLFQERIGNLIRAAHSRARAASLELELAKATCFEGMIGRSPEILETFAAIRKIAPHYQTVLISGATGTGKELVARALHHMSPVAHQPFVVCGCADIVETLLESELFGVTKGAYTGAYQDRRGLFEAADGGTLFLDEVGEIPIQIQSKLLHALQRKEIRRVGSTVHRKVDLRVIAATNRDLRKMVEEREFRDDLFYRLAMVEIHLSKLLNRKDDIWLLERYFIERFSGKYRKNIKGSTHRAETLLSRFHWPGNVRELENVIGHACMMATGDMIDICDLPDYPATLPTKSRR